MVSIKIYQVKKENSLRKLLKSFFVRSIACRLVFLCICHSSLAVHKKKSIRSAIKVATRVWESFRVPRRTFQTLWDEEENLYRKFFYFVVLCSWMSKLFICVMITTKWIHLISIECDRLKSNILWGAKKSFFLLSENKKLFLYLVFQSFAKTGDTFFVQKQICSIRIVKQRTDETRPQRMVDVRLVHYQAVVFQLLLASVPVWKEKKLLVACSNDSLATAPASARLHRQLVFWWGKDGRLDVFLEAFSSS